VIRAPNLSKTSEEVFDRLGALITRVSGTLVRSAQNGTKSSHFDVTLTQIFGQKEHKMRDTRVYCAVNSFA